MKIQPMKISGLILKVAGSFTLMFSLQANAVDIQFPQEQLARESVYPIFDNPEAVKRRNVILENRIELGAYGGWTLNDALSDPMTGGLMVTYHFTETHAFHVQGGVFTTKPSQYVPQLEADNIGLKNLASGPQPKYMVLGNYQITPYYGKISITKQAVMNLSIFGTAGIGTIAIGDSNYMAFGLGLGQKLYFTSNLGLRADLKVLFYQSPNTLSRAIPDGEKPANSFFEKHNVTNSLLTIGMIYLL